MTVADALRGIQRLFLDTSPVICYIEEHPRYIDRVGIVLDQIDTGLLVGVTSPVTLAECLVVPYRLGSTALEQHYIGRIAHGRHTEFVLIDEHVTRRAAELRARYRLRLADALQAAVALHARCDALLTNDPICRRVAELSVLLVDELGP